LRIAKLQAVVLKLEATMSWRSDNSNIKLLAVLVVIFMSVWVWLALSVAALPTTDSTVMGFDVESTIPKPIDPAPLLPRRKTP